MKKIMCVFAILAIASFAFAAEPTDPGASPRNRCPVCGMFTDLFADWNATIEFKDNTHATFDGSKDLFKYYLDIQKYNPNKSKADVAAVRVKDYYSKNSIDGLRAYYVIWGDLYGPMGHEPIPFEKEADAKKYLQVHHGKKIVKAREITPKLLWSLDNPE